MAGVRNINGETFDLWEKAETVHGVPYYINHVDESTQWDHPVIEKLIEDLETYNIIKYAAYRTSLKISKIQRLLNLDAISLTIIKDILSTTHILSTNGSKTITCSELQALVTELFLFAKEKSSLLFFDYKLYGELLTNILLDMCDLSRKGGKVPILYMKVYLAVFCSGRLPDKYRYIFSLFSNSRGTVSELELTKMFHILAEIPEFLFEGNSFGSKLVSGAVKSCMSQIPHEGDLTEDIFLEWLLREPQNLVWLSTLTRLTAAERVQHDVKCKVCKKFPIFGFRYSCLKCINYDQCQQCFFMGFYNKNHKISHPIQEYCRVANPSEETKAFLKKLGNKLRITPHSRKKRYLPINTTNTSIKIGDSLIESTIYHQQSENLSPEKKSQMLQTDEYLWEGSRVLMHTSFDEAQNKVQNNDYELESIIVHLEDENKNFLSEIQKLRRRSLSTSCSSSSSSENDEEQLRALMMAQNTAFNEHNKNIQLQVEKLRQLLQKQERKIESATVQKAPKKQKEVMQSTPTANEPHASFKNLSPIEVDQNTPSSENNDNKYKEKSCFSNQVPSRQSLRRKVLKSLNQNTCSMQQSAVTPKSSKHNSNKSLVNHSTSRYNVSNITFGNFSGSTFSHLTNSHYTLPHAQMNNTNSKVKDDLQDVIEQLENITSL